MRASTVGLLSLVLVAQSVASPPSSALDGRVLDALTNAPVRGALVAAPGVRFDTDIPHDAAVLTAADGTFALPTVTRPSSLATTKAGYLDARMPVPPSGVAPVVIFLTPSASIVGRVLDPAGDPVPGARVRAALAGETREALARTATADDRGQYIIDGLAAGEYVVTAGYTAGDAMTFRHPSPAAAVVSAGEERVGIDLRVDWDPGLAQGVPKPLTKMAGPAGTASLSGTVRRRDGRGAANVIVSAWPGPDALPAGVPMWSAIADTRGAFEIANVPAGTYTLRAHRPRYPSGTVPITEPVGPVQLTAGERRSDLELVVRQGGAISGVIRDESGDPVRADVTLLSVADNLTPYQYGPATATDDRGRYRFADLRPGRYAVMAARRMASPIFTSDSSELRLAGPAPIFHPGVRSIDLASVIVIQIQPEAEILAIDLSIGLEPIADVDLSVAAPSPIAAMRVRQISQDGRIGLVMGDRRAATVVTDDGYAGTVSLSGVPGGRWLFRVEVTSEAAAKRETFWARHETTTDGRSRHSVTLPLEPAARVSGVVVYEGGDAPRPVAELKPGTTALPRTVFHVALVSEDARFDVVPALDGRFSLSAMPGTYSVQAVEMRDGLVWTLSRATLNGQDVLDIPVELAPSAELSGLTLTISRESTELTGVVSDAAGRPVPYAELAIVPADPRYQGIGSRRVRRITTTAAGTYSVRGLPPGEYRVGPVPAALTVGALKQVPQPAPSVVVRLAAGERRTQPITIVR